MIETPTASLSSTINLLENRLQKSLNPVRPRSDYVYGMKRRFVAGKGVGLEPNSPLLIYLVLALGVFAGALLFWILRRAQ